MMNIFHFLRRISCLIVIAFFFPPIDILAETRNWTGSGGDMYWSNPMNWSGAVLPGITDDVILDNSLWPVSFLVVLPDEAVTIRTLHIKPSAGRNIELILPATNMITNGLTVTGPGYGIELEAGAIFRNASGIASGESLSIADSLFIHDGARYIHQTRAAHANNILRILSLSPGSGQGIFDFDVPRASYTISVSNRVYGCLELHADAMGSTVNYTCSGANPLHVRGNLRIGPAVNMSMNLSGSNGNIQVDGDFLQEGGQLNLATGSGSQTILRVGGNLVQSAASVITETANGNPYLELNGTSQQEITMAGRILNQVGFRVNNPVGCILHLPLRLPYILHLLDGSLISSTTAMLTLDTNCRLIIDSSRQTGIYVEGPFRKLGFKAGDYFLYPVGKTGVLRWLALTGVAGDYIVEYFRNDPNDLGSDLAPGLDHISKLEYWTVTGSSGEIINAKIELSFASAQCGGVTDPQFLNVAKFQSAMWVDAGHSAITGNAIQGSVSSYPTALGADTFTLASTINLENPLPVTQINLSVKEVLGEMIYNWTIESSEKPDHFDLNEESDRGPLTLVQIPGKEGNSNYRWIGPALKNGNHFFSVKMTDIHGLKYIGKTVLFVKKSDKKDIYWVTESSIPGNTGLVIEVSATQQWQYEIISMSGTIAKKGFLQLHTGKNYMHNIPDNLAGGIYVLVLIRPNGEKQELMLRSI